LIWLSVEWLLVDWLIGDWLQITSRACVFTFFNFSTPLRLYGLIGWPLGHSFSKKYFGEKFEREGIHDVRYELFPLENIADLPALLTQNPALRGLNVTIPYKESVIPFLDDLDETAQAVGAVNCIKVLENHLLIGYNTDVVGFEKSLPKEQVERWQVERNTALILGTGGASKAVAFVLKKLKIPFKFVSRNPHGEDEVSYESFIVHSSSFIVNTTPLGTFPQVEEMPPLPIDLFKPDMFVYDLIYNPAETLLLREAKSRGCVIKNGLEMLELQAEAAWEIWRREH
jgi:shikimate dehydrogenase